MSNKSTKIQFRGSPKALRKELLRLNRHPAQRVMQLKEIPKPKYVTQTNGVRVKYEGP